MRELELKLGSRVRSRVVDLDAAIMSRIAMMKVMIQRY